MRIVAVAAQQLGQFLPADARQHRRVGDLEAVEMKDRKHRAVARGIEEFVGVPTGGERAGFRFAVADDAADDQVGIVEGGAIGVSQRIAEFAAFMDRAGRFRRDVAGNSVGPGKLAKQPLQSVPAAFDRRIVLGVRAFQIAVRHDARTAVARTDDVDHVQIVVLDQPVEVDVEEIQPRRRAPMAEQPRLDMFELEGRFEQRIVLQIDLADRKIIRRAPIGVHFPEEIGRQGIRHHGLRNGLAAVCFGGALYRIGCPGDQFCCDACEGVIERGDGGGRIRLVEFLALLKQARSDDLPLLVQDPCRKPDLGGQFGIRVDLEASDVDEKLRIGSRIVHRAKRRMGDIVVFKALNEFDLQHLRNAVRPLGVRESRKLLVGREQKSLGIEQEDRRRRRHHKLLA